MNSARRIVIIGAGMGGLAAAITLAASGLEVIALEAAPRPGGKMREVDADGLIIDAGPTVLTMRWVFDELFARAGAPLSERLSLRRIERLARHAWPDGSRLDLYSDVARSAEAIREFAGPREAEGYRQFCRRAQSVYQTLRESYIAAPQTDPLGLARRLGAGGFPKLVRISPFATLWGALGDHFADPRLRQMFGRYATYCGSSPFQAPATLMLIAHVEREGVWLVEGGMARLAEAMWEAARDCGASFHFGRRVKRVLLERDRAAGVEMDDGERISAAATVWNGDVAALADGNQGLGAGGAVGALRGERSLSAITWALAASVEGFPLIRHNVFFSPDYASEFDAMFARQRLPRAPTVYACAQDRTDDDLVAGLAGRERLFCVINAPALPPNKSLSPVEIEECEAAAFRLMERCGLTIHRTAQATVRTTPEDFARLFPSTQGALYGRATHGWRATFTRPGSASRIPGLYLAGGSVHPGPGAPMAALSGRLAAERILKDLGSIKKSIPAATRGGTRTR
jgi:1-hydroxycarotenoid 3,4-desaturase